MGAADAQPSLSWPAFSIFLDRSKRLTEAMRVREHLCSAPQHETTLNNGYLGLGNDEERSEMRYVV